MPTLNRRLNITLPPELDWAISKIAKRDGVPDATKAVELLRNALLVEEDSVWARLAEERYKIKSKHISHKEAWK